MRSLLSVRPPAANQTRAAGLAAEGLVPAGAVGAAAGQHQTVRPALAGADVGSEQPVSGGAREGPRDLEQAEASSEGGGLRPGGAGDETGGPGQVSAGPVFAD